MHCVCSYYSITLWEYRKDPLYSEQVYTYLMPPSTRQESFQMGNEVGALSSFTCSCAEAKPAESSERVAEPPRGVGVMPGRGTLQQSCAEGTPSGPGAPHGDVRPAAELLV